MLLKRNKCAKRVEIFSKNRCEYTHQKALELTQKPDKWTWNNDELTPEDVTFDPHNMMLCPPK
jgi:hypothetical protein